MHESLGDRRKEVQGARFIYFVKQLHNNLSRVWRLPQGPLSHEFVTLIEADAPALLTNICESSNEKILVNTSHCSSTRNGDNVGLLIKTDSTQNE